MLLVKVTPLVLQCNLNMLAMVLSQSRSPSAIALFLFASTYWYVQCVSEGAGGKQKCSKYLYEPGRLMASWKHRLVNE